MLEKKEKSYVVGPWQSPMVRYRDVVNNAGSKKKMFLPVVLAKLKNVGTARESAKPHEPDKATKSKLCICLGHNFDGWYFTKVMSGQFLWYLHRDKNILQQKGIHLMYFTEICDGIFRYNLSWHSLTNKEFLSRMFWIVYSTVSSHTKPQSHPTGHVMGYVINYVT